jgi:hypothetical protein
MVLKLLRLGVRGIEEFRKNSKAKEAEILVGIKLGSLSKYLVKLTQFLIDRGRILLFNNGVLYWKRP